MARRSEFVDYLLEQLSPLGEVTAKAMFGGWGIYHEGRMFALVADDALYLKVDDESRPVFEAAGLEPFRYTASQTVHVMAYFTVPDAAIDDRELLCEWARKGVEAARRAAEKKSAPKASKKPRKK